MILQPALKVFCIDFYAKDVKHKSDRNLLRIIISISLMGFVSFSGWYYRMSTLYEPLKVNKITDTFQAIYDYCVYLVDVYFVHRYGQEIASQYFNHRDYIDKTLRLTDKSIENKRLTNIVWLFSFIWLVSTVGNYLGWYFSFAWDVPLAFSTIYLFFLIKILSSLDLTAQVLHIEGHLHGICAIVMGCYNRYQNMYFDLTSNIFVSDPVYERHWFYSNNHYPPSIQPQLGTPRLYPDNYKHDIPRLRRCYLLILEQCYFISKMYGIRILLCTISLVIEMIRITNLGVKLSVRTQQTTHYFIDPALFCVWRGLACACVLLSLVVHCERAALQRRKIIAVIDHLLANKYLHEELKCGIAELRALMESRPVSFNMAGLFDLNYSLLVSTTSVVVTYTIILMQNVKNN